MIDPAGNAFPWLLSPVLLTQGAWVKARTPRLPEAPGPHSGETGAGPVFRLVALGDSIIAGVGVSNTGEALPAQLAAALAERLNRNVRWSSHGRNGARTRDLLHWPADDVWQEANLVVVSNGLNDVTGVMALGPWLEQKSTLYQRLRKIAPKAGIAQLGLPPLGHFPALPQPLRRLIGLRAEAFDRALENLIAPLPNVAHLPFREVPEPRLFAADGYHPGPEAVGIWARSLADMLMPVTGKER